MLTRACTQLLVSTYTPHVVKQILIRLATLTMHVGLVSPHACMVKPSVHGPTDVPELASIRYCTRALAHVSYVAVIYIAYI